MSDNDLIRRGDARDILSEEGWLGDSLERINALPPAKQDDLASGKAVTLRVKPLVWDDWHFTKFAFDPIDGQSIYAETQEDIDCIEAERQRRIRAALEPVAAPAQCCMCGKRDLSTEEDGGPECQMNDGRWVCSRKCYSTACALLEPVAAPDPAAIREAALYEALTDVLDAIGALSKPRKLIGYGMSQDDIDRILALIHKPQSGIEKVTDK